MQEPFSGQRATSPQNELLRFIEIFSREGWLDKQIKIKYQDRKYWIFCSQERFLTYQINENWGLGPGVPGWPVYTVDKDYVYDESTMANLAPDGPDRRNWLNIIAGRSFELS